MTSIDDELHARIHRQMLEVAPAEIFGPRVRVFDRVERWLGASVSGRVLDVGCGNGYASIWLALHRPVSEVVALEGSPAAVAELIPRNVAHHGVADRVTPTLGSFDDIGVDAGFDHVVAFGALHHSRCLWSTMASISRALKPGGLLIANEPVMPDTTSNQRYLDKYDVVEERHGLSIRNGDRDDHFFRHAEYVVAAAFNQLDLVLEEPFDAAANQGLRARARRLVGRLRRRVLGARKRAPGAAPRVADYTRGLESRIMVFRKAPLRQVPHLWRPLREAPACAD